MTTVFDASQMNQLSSTFIGVGRNRVINGEMRIDQANGGNAVTVNNVSTTFYSVDQFVGFGVNSAGVFTLQRQTATPPTGFLTYLRATTTTADASPASSSQYRIAHYLEGNNVRDMVVSPNSNQTLSLSFWARSSLTGTFGGIVRLIASVSNDAYYPFSYTIAVANTWVRYSVVITPNLTVTNVGVVTNQNGSIQLGFDLGCGSALQGIAGTWTSTQTCGVIGATRVISTNAATFDLTGVQLEIGSVPTPFEYKPYMMEFQLCQRYFEKSYSLDVNPGTATGAGAHAGPGAITNSGTSVTRFSPIFFKVQKRAVPTCSIWDTNGVSGHLFTTNTSDVNTSRTGDTATISDYEFTVRSSAGTDLYCGAVQWTADARF